MIVGLVMRMGVRVVRVVAGAIRGRWRWRWLRRRLLEAMVILL